MSNLETTDFGRDRIKDECLIALKVYDQCRQQDCLTPNDLDPVRSAEEDTCTIGGTSIAPGAIIGPLPPTVASVKIVDKHFRIDSIITHVEPRRLTKDGYWDVTVEFKFVFELQFKAADCSIIPVICNNVPKNSICATSSFTKTVTLFGSVGSDLVIASNLFSPQTSLLKNKPFVLVEAKAVNLDVALSSSRLVNVTIGLFVVIKLFRLVTLNVLSTGFCKPKPCTECPPADPCTYFNGLEFPFDIFNPPQKEDWHGNNGDSDCVDDLE